MTQTTFTLPVGPYESDRSGLSPPRPDPTPADDDGLREGAPDGELWSPGRALPEDALVETVALLDAQVAALRARLSAVEEVVGLPVQPRRPAPPTLPELRRRLATLERRAGIVPGLDPLPGLAPAVTPEPDLPAPAARGRAAWLARGREAAVVAVLLAVVLLLARPTVDSRRAATPTGARPTAPATVTAERLPPADPPQRVAAAPALSLPAAPAPDNSSDYGTEHDPFVIGNSQRWYVPAAPASPPASGELPGESPCALGGTAPCSPPRPPHGPEPAEPTVPWARAEPGFIGPLREIHENDEAPDLRGASSQNRCPPSTQPECAE